MKFKVLHHPMLLEKLHGYSMKDGKGIFMESEVLPLFVMMPPINFFVLVYAVPFFQIPIS